jgi:spore coat polysaccharide biosynthesis protein SpsF
VDDLVSKPCVAAIIQARMGSTRLPGKVLRRLGDHSMLEAILCRVREARRVDKIIVATTTLAKDDAIARLCAKLHTECFRGSPENVLSRYYKAAKASSADIIIRLTGDNPLVDPKIVDQAVAEFLGKASRRKAEFLTTTGYPIGINIEMMTFECLRKLVSLARRADELEHVTLYIHRHSRRFRVACVNSPIALGTLRLTVDDMSDLRFVRKIYKRLSGSAAVFGLPEILRFLLDHPSLPGTGTTSRKGKSVRSI